MVYSPTQMLKLPTGQQVAYSDEGGGARTLLFVHGLGTSSAGWMKNISVLAKTHRCVAIDLPGNGQSPAATDGNYTMKGFANTLLHFIGSLGLQNVCLVGHSMGAQVCIEAMLAVPGCADRAVLCAPAGLETFTEWEQMMSLQSLHFSDWITSDEDALRRSLHSSFFHFPKEAQNMVETLVTELKKRSASERKAMLHACIRSMLQESVLARLPQLKQPVLVLFGEMDALIPARLIHATTTKRLAETAVKKFHAAKLKMIPRCGHFLQWEAADTVNKAILEWAGKK